MPDKDAFFEEILTEVKTKFDMVAKRCIEGVHNSENSLKAIKGVKANTKPRNAGMSDVEKIEMQFKIDRTALMTEFQRFQNA